MNWSLRRTMFISDFFVHRRIFYTKLKPKISRKALLRSNCNTHCSVLVNQSHVSASGHSLMLLLRLLRSYGMKNESYTISVAAHGCPRQLLRLLRLPCSTTIAYVRVSCSAVSTALPPARVGHHSKWALSDC